MSRKKTAMVSALVLLTGITITALIYITEPRAKRGGATKETAMLVDVVTAQQGNFKPIISALGKVEPSQSITLSPRVGGEIISLSGAFIPGGLVRKGDGLLRIDPADYQNNLEQRKSELRQTIADLNIEMGRQNVAQKDYQILQEILSEEQEALILRKPQLNAARARVEAARASVQQAELELRRTIIRAPFDAHILNRSVNVGSQVSPGQNLGQLVGIDSYWVMATLPLSKLRWLQFPSSEKNRGSEVLVRNRTGWAEGSTRRGFLYKLVGTLEEKTRLARVLVVVPDPLSLKEESRGLPVLMLGSFVEARIQAREIKDVFRLKRDFIRKKNTVWVMEERTLRIRPVNILFMDENHAYIDRGLTHGEPVVTTNLTTVVDGAGLRLESDLPASEKGLQPPATDNPTEKEKP
jgi:RND family efflux transporter MFP subunit